MDGGCGTGADEMAHFIKLAVLLTEEEAVLFALAEARSVFGPWNSPTQAVLSLHRHLLDYGVLSDFVMGMMSAFLTIRRNRESSDWLWTPAALIFTSVLLCLLRFPRPHPLQNWRSSLERCSSVCISTWQTLSARLNFRWRGGKARAQDLNGERGGGRRLDTHLPAVPRHADGVDACSCLQLLPNHSFSSRSCRRAPVQLAGATS